MNTTRYRNWIRRYGKIGVLMVGGALLMHWLRRRRLRTLAAALVVGAVLWPLALQNHMKRNAAPIDPPIPAKLQASTPSPSRRLKDRATKVCRTGDWLLSTSCMNAYWYMTYQWTSDHTLTYFTDDDRMDNLLHQLDVRTNKRESYRAASRLWSVDGDYKKQIAISPDGKWILWWGDFYDHQYHGCYGARRDGTSKFRFEEPYSKLIWLPDSKRFITDTAIRSVNLPARIGSAPASFPEVEDFGEIQYVSDRYLVLVRDDLAGSNAYIVDRYDLSAAMPSKTTWRIDWQYEEECKELKVSPNGERIAWIRVQNPVRIDADHVKQRVRIRTTALDGSNLLEVGAIETIDDPDKEQLPNFIAGPHELHWLPEGKKLSFILKNVLYTVPIP